MSYCSKLLKKLLHLFSIAEVVTSIPAAKPIYILVTLLHQETNRIHQLCLWNRLLLAAAPPSGKGKEILIQHSPPTKKRVDPVKENFSSCLVQLNKYTPLRPIGETFLLQSTSRKLTLWHKLNMMSWKFVEPTTSLMPFFSGKLVAKCNAEKRCLQYWPPELINLMQMLLGS